MSQKYFSSAIVLTFLFSFIIEAQPLSKQNIYFPSSGKENKVSIPFDSYKNTVFFQNINKTNNYPKEAAAVSTKIISKNIEQSFLTQKRNSASFTKETNNSTLNVTSVFLNQKRNQ